MDIYLYKESAIEEKCLYKKVVKEKMYYTLNSQNLIKFEY